MRDGDIEYSKYTLLELEEALAGINKHQYPKNYANLRSAHEQLTATIADAPQPQIVATANDTARRDADRGSWDRFWDSRPIAIVMGAICLWWAYDLFTQTDSCPSKKKLIGAIVNAICENYGHAASAGIPFVLGLLSVAYAVLPRRRAGA